jgi:hypothetical protein
LYQISARGIPAAQKILKKVVIMDELLNIDVQDRLHFEDFTYASAAVMARIPARPILATV